MSSSLPTSNSENLLNKGQLPHFNHVAVVRNSALDRGRFLQHFSAVQSARLAGPGFPVFLQGLAIGPRIQNGCVC